MLAVHDEGVDGDLRVAEHQATADRDRARRAPPPPRRRAARTGGVRARQHGEDDAVRRVVQQPAEPGGRRRSAGLAGEHVLGVGVGPVLAHQRQDARADPSRRAVRVTTRDRELVPDTGALPWTVAGDCTSGQA